MTATDHKAAPLSAADQIERLQFLKRNVGDWTEADADDVCQMALDALGDAKAYADAAKFQRERAEAAEFALKASQDELADLRESCAMHEAGYDVFRKSKASPPVVMTRLMRLAQTAAPHGGFINQPMRTILDITPSDFFDLVKSLTAQAVSPASPEPMLQEVSVPIALVEAFGGSVEFDSDGASVNTAGPCHEDWVAMHDILDAVKRGERPLRDVRGKDHE